MQHIKSLLVATDLSDSSDHAVRAAAALAELTGAALHVLHAFEFESSQYPQASGQRLTFPGLVAAGNAGLDEQLARVLRGKHNPMSRQVVVHVAFKAIRDRVRSIDANLIVLARHRPRARADSFLGTTADRVIRTVDVPCLIVPGPMNLPFRRILVPIDLSEPAIGALEIALSWANLLGPHAHFPVLDILHVIPRVFDFAAVPLDLAYVHTQLDEAVTGARMRTGVDAGIELHQEVRWADSPADEIVSFAEEDAADLIVMGTHGRGAFKRALIGSVASGVARTANQPVLLVPPALWKNATDDLE